MRASSRQDQAGRRARCSARAGLCASARLASLLVAIASAATACGGGDIRAMTASPTDRARRRYAEESRADSYRGREPGEVAAGGAGGGAATGEARAPTSPAPVVSPAEPERYEHDVETEAVAEDSGASFGAPPPPPEAGADVHRRSVDTLATASGSASASVDRILNIGAFAAVEPLPWVPLDPAPLPAGPRRVLLASLELPPGRAVFPPSSSCQDVLLYVGEGTLSASGTGIGTLEAPATLYPGDAVRFGPEADARVENVGATTVRAALAIARREGTGVPLYTVPDEAERCPEALAPDPLVRPMRLGHRATAAPLLVAGGHLAVRILLDADGSGAMHAGLAVLEGDAEARVAPHVHETSAELLFIEDGAGTMTIGERAMEIRPGMVVYVPEGVTHAFEPSGARPLVVLQVYAPSGPEQRFRGLSGAP